MKDLYSLLYAFSILLINIWGNSRGAIWTQPKVFVLLLIFNLNLLILIEAKANPLQKRRNSSCQERERANSDKISEFSSKTENCVSPLKWYNSLLLWMLFLGAGALSTFGSPTPLLSLFGQEQMGDGWLYWLLVAGFTLSNISLLRLYPQLLRSQLEGLIFGGFLLALSIFPQAIDWRIDYTATTGKLRESNVLLSTIFQNQQPIGLYSHRGHAAFVLAFTGLLALAGWKWGLFSAKKVTILVIPIVVALLLTQTRIGIIVLLFGTLYLLRGKYFKLLVFTTLIAGLVIGNWTELKRIDNVSLINQKTSGRVEMGRLALKAIQERPLWGWGFDGFGLAYPYVRYPNWTPNVLRIDSFGFEYRSVTGERRTVIVPTFKAHNLLLDTTVSVGIIGLFLYAALWIYFLKCIGQSSARGIEVLALVYLIFTFTWFECAQYTHLAWWSLSLWGVERVNDCDISY